jgi:hypothetical protein
MRGRALRGGWALAVVLWAPLAGAANRAVGPGQTYATPCAAIGVAQPGDEIDVAAGHYTDSCEINAAGLTVKGVGGRPTIDLSGTNHPADFKGIYVVSADDVTLENLELTGAHVDDSEGGNAAGVRATGHGLVIHGCYIHDNQNGVLAAPTVDGGTITIEYSELAHNGLGDECDHDGCTHNVYISKTSSTVRYDKTVFQFNWSHDLASDTADKGHLFKSRSRETDVLYNRITGEAGHDSYEVDIPNGGLGIVVGNAIEKGTDPDNDVLLAFGEEGIDNPQASLYVVSNTFANDFTKGTFVETASGATFTAHDNIFAGPGTPSSAGALAADNLAGTIASFLFAGATSFDYHLTTGSPAIGKAVAPGTAGSFALTPAFEYVQPLESVARASDHDVGAFEYGTVVADAGTEASAEPGDASSSAPVDSGESQEAGSVGAGADAGAGGPPASGDAGLGASDGASNGGASGGAASSGGCGCVLAERTPRTAPSLAVAVALALCLRRRRGTRVPRSTRAGP